MPDDYLRFITVNLVIEDVCNPSDHDALEFVKEILNEAFGKEAAKESPRVSLRLMDVRHAHGATVLEDFLGL